MGTELLQVPFPLVFPLPAEIKGRSHLPFPHSRYFPPTVSNSGNRNHYIKLQQTTFLRCWTGGKIVNTKYQAIVSQVGSHQEADQLSNSSGISSPPGFWPCSSLVNLWIPVATEPVSENQFTLASYYPLASQPFQEFRWPADSQTFMLTATL